MTKEGTAICINGEEYVIKNDFGELYVIQKDNYFSLFFPALNILIPCGKKMVYRRTVHEKNYLSFNGIKFYVDGYNTQTHEMKDVFCKLTDRQLLFRITMKTGELLNVDFK